VESLRVISRSDKQHGRGVWPYPVMVEKLRGVRGEHLGDPLVEVIDLRGELEDAAGEQPQRVDRGADDIAGRAGGQLRALANEPAGAQPRQGFPRHRQRRSCPSGR